MRYIIVAAFAAFAAAAPQINVNGNIRGGFFNGDRRFRCPGNNEPQCCQTDVLDAASITCNPPSRDPFTRDDFVAICAETGTTANCCDFTFATFGLGCQDVTRSTY